MEVNIRNLSYTYSKVNYEKKEILKDINIDFKEGKISAIIGHGKTTLISLIYGLLEKEEGKIIIGNYELNKKTKERLRFDIGISFQNLEDSFLYDTVFDELASNLKMYNYKINQAKKRISDSLIMVGLDDSYMTRKIETLSTGEKRKLSLASALILNPKILILDEPTLNLDKKSKKELIKLLRLLKNRYKKTIIIASNNTDFVLEFADYVYVLHDKKIVLQGNKMDVFTNNDLEKYDIEIPKIIKFEKLVEKKKNIKIGYRFEINDLIKDIYRYVK